MSSTSTSGTALPSAFRRRVRYNHRVGCKASVNMFLVRWKQGGIKTSGDHMPKDDGGLPSPSLLSCPLPYLLPPYPLPSPPCLPVCPTLPCPPLRNGPPKIQLGGLESDLSSPTVAYLGGGGGATAPPPLAWSMQEAVRDRPPPLVW
jgi:hypothetical protein